MSGTWKWYGSGLLNWANGNIDFNTDTFKIMLLKDTYTPDQDAHDYRNDLVAASNEPAASGTYVAGGASIGSATTSYDSASNELRITWSPDPQWTSATITARHAVIYKSRGGADTADELVAYCTESANVASTSGTFTVDLPAYVLKVTAA